ncbi:MAG: hypothetical protein ACFFD6_04990, partial [Candidatus Thorarchaeota archaeon]
MKGKRPADDSQATLEDFFSSNEAEDESRSEELIDESESASNKNQESSESNASSLNQENELDTNDEEPVDDEEEVVTEVRVGEREVPENLDSSYLLSIDYAGAQKKAFARLYNPDDKKIYFWFDNTGHLPYCYTDLPPQAAESRIGKHGGFVRTEGVELTDLLRDEPVKMTKVIASDPLSIGGSQGAIRERLVDRSGEATISRAWEANIRYRNCYTYDRNLVSGLPYKIDNGNLIPSIPKLDEKMLSAFKKTFEAEEGLDRIIKEYAPMFFTEVPDIRRIALDIEVYTPVKNRIPDANTAPYPVTAIGLSDNESYNKCFVLKRSGMKEGKKRP